MCTEIVATRRHPAVTVPRLALTRGCVQLQQESESRMIYVVILL